MSEEQSDIKQNFKHNDIGAVAGRDVHIHNTPAQEGKVLLTKKQRGELNELIQDIAAGKEEVAKELWAKIHNRSDVNNVDEMNVSHFLPAIAFLKVEKRKRNLVRQLMQLKNSHPPVFEKARTFAQKNYGAGLFTELDLDELVATLKDINVAEEISPEETEGICTHDCDACREEYFQQFSGQINELIGKEVTKRERHWQEKRTLAEQKILATAEKDKKIATRWAYLKSFPLIILAALSGYSFAVFTDEDQSQLKKAFSSLGPAPKTTQKTSAPGPDSTKPQEPKKK